MCLQLHDGEVVVHVFVDLRAEAGVESRIVGAEAEGVDSEVCGKLLQVADQCGADAAVAVFGVDDQCGQPGAEADPLLVIVLDEFHCADGRAVDQCNSR